MNPYLRLALAAFLPVVASILLFLLERKTPYGKLPYIVKQIIAGIIFGGLAIVGTEHGIPINGALINCRDAAVLSAGLLFGGPAGIIAGIIGGVERYLAYYFRNLGAATYIACCVSTAVAGLYAALLRKFMFENKKPGWLMSLAIGIVMEVFHLSMVFFTNMSDPVSAAQIVRSCTVPMVLANGISTMLATLGVAIVSHENLGFKREKVRISQTIQRWMLITVAMAFLLTSIFVYTLQTTVADRQTEKLLQIGLEETVQDINEVSDENLLLLTKRIAEYAAPGNLEWLAKEYNVADINIVDENGIIIASNTLSFYGIDLSKEGKQSAEFMCLLDDKEEFVQNYGPTSFNENISRKYAGVRFEDGFLQVGYDAVRFQEDLGESVKGITKNRHIGETGFIIIVDIDLNVVSAPESVTIVSLEEENDTTDIPEANTTFEMTVGGERCFARYITTEGYSIISVLPEEEAMRMRNIVLYVNSFMETLVFAAMFFLIYLLIKKVVVDRIKRINQSLARITGGNLNEVVDVRSNEEFSSLSDDINTTVDTLKKYISEASARIDAELEFAKNIQVSALPGTFPAFPKRKDFDIYAMMDTAKEVGGDFYDFYLTHNEQLNFLIADVSGKGIPAAMFMMRAKTELKSLTETDEPLCDVFTNGNNALCEGNDAGMFVTAWQGCLNLETGLVQYANAGHNPPLVRHADGQFEYLRSKVGFVLAGMEGVQYKTQEIKLVPGDILFLYTDGVTEATDADGKLYGEERLLNCVNSVEFTTVEALCKAVRADVDAFVGEAPQFDDITMLSLTYVGKKPAPEIRFEEAALENIPDVTAFVEEQLELLGCPMKTTVQIDVAIDEIYSNIARYAYPGKKGPATVRLQETENPHGVQITFIDEGIPYNPVTKEDPDTTLSAEERDIGGLGIFMVKKTMDDMVYRYENDRNILTLTKYF